MQACRCRDDFICLSYLFNFFKKVISAFVFIVKKMIPIDGYFVLQPKLHSDVNDGCLMHQGFMWKRNGSSETRFWALLFTDALLLTHVMR